MEIRGKKVLVLGGWGLVGSAIARELVLHEPATLVLTSLTEAQSKDAVRQIKLEFPDSRVAVSGESGDLFQREEFKHLTREAILADPAKRRVVMNDLLHELNRDILEANCLYNILNRHRPEIIIDCINSATAFAYQDIYKTSADVVTSLDDYRGPEDFDGLKADVEKLVCTGYTPQLIRHVQILYNAMLASGTKIYVKIGTSGTGGMGLNIPYTHSEERPSRVLLSKSAVAGAHTLLLFLMARTPNGPIIKEFKPTALIAWKKIEHGKIAKRGQQVKLRDLPPEHALPLTGQLTRELDPRLKSLFDGQDAADLEAVFIDTGENGIFTAAEFEAVTMIGQMQFITPEEIAQNVIFEIQAGNTGHDIINALDQAALGPTYRAGAMRHSALARMHELERKHEARGVAFEMLGPPKLSKILWEAEILRLLVGTLDKIADTDAEVMAAAALKLVESDATLRARILSIGIPILLADGKRLLRGPEIKVPVFHGRRDLEITDAAIEKWADAGWVDLRVANFKRWRARAQEIRKEVSAIPFNDTSSRYDRDREFWFGDGEINVGRVAGWIFISEDKGRRMK